MNQRECITAIIPVRNGAFYLPNFLKNVIDICSDTDEILFVEDHSTDETLAMLHAYSGQYSNIKVVRAEKPGLVNALNQGVAESSNEWLARFDCDDKYARTRLETQAKMISQNVVCVFSDYKISDPNGRDFGFIPSPVDPLPTRLSLITNLRTPHPIALMRKSAVLQVGGYNTSDFPAEDLSLWLRLSRVGELVSSPDTLLTYSLHNNSITGTRYLESKTKAHELYRAHGIEHYEIDAAITNFKNQRIRYLQNSFSKERTFLHYVDIFRNMLNSDYRRIQTIIFLVRNFHLDYFSAFTGLRREARRRQRFRNANQSKNSPVYAK